MQILVFAKVLNSKFKSYKKCNGVDNISTNYQKVFQQHILLYTCIRNIHNNT